MYSIYGYTVIGILKAVHGNQTYAHNRVTKDVVAFCAGDFPDLVEKLQLDLHEPPISQVKVIGFVVIISLYFLSLD